MKINTFYILILILFFQNTLAQSDSIQIDNHLTPNKKIEIQQVAIPASLITLGIVGQIKPLKQISTSTQQEVVKHFDRKYRFDDYLQYTPALGVFALSNLGFQARHNLKERLIITATAYTIAGIGVNSIKYTTKVMRPDQSQANSFPSGHTTTAFVGAEILWQEYKDENIWIGITGYTLATTTGIMRIINNRHWITDVIAGAGLGILSAKIAYWILPTTSRWFSKDKNKSLILTAIPTYISENKSGGLSINLNF
ncbi:MAG: phosphatase PAP2 family protein [Flavobacteriaceae bacterium]|nr:phosphatase PAP2 family protein [Flavobacteriaceae bacterium]